MYDMTINDINQNNTANETALQNVCAILLLQILAEPERFSVVLKACNFVCSEASMLIRYDTVDFMQGLLEHLQAFPVSKRSAVDQRGIKETIKFLNALIIARQAYLGTSAEPNVHSN